MRRFPQNSAKGFEKISSLLFKKDGCLRTKDLKEIKEAYLSGKDIASICTLFNITRSTFYYQKRKAKENGDDWDLDLLREAREDLKVSEEYFLSTLIHSFEKALQEGEPSLGDLDKYAQTYWKLKAPKNDDEFKLKEKLKSAIEQTIREIANLALALDHEVVVEFLSQNSDEIISRVFKK